MYNPSRAIPAASKSKISICKNSKANKENTLTNVKTINYKGKNAAYFQLLHLRRISIQKNLLKKIGRAE